MKAVFFYTFGVHNPKFDLKIGSILSPDRERSDARNPCKIKASRAIPIYYLLLLVLQQALRWAHGKVNRRHNQVQPC